MCKTAELRCVSQIDSELCTPIGSTTNHFLKYLNPICNAIYSVGERSEHRIYLIYPIFTKPHYARFYISVLTQFGSGSNFRSITALIYSRHYLVSLRDPRNFWNIAYILMIDRLDLVVDIFLRDTLPRNMY